MIMTNNGNKTTVKNQTLNKQQGKLTTRKEETRNYITKKR